MFNGILYYEINFVGVFNVIQFNGLFEWIYFWMNWIINYLMNYYLIDYYLTHNYLMDSYTNELNNNLDELNILIYYWSLITPRLAVVTPW